MEPLGLYGYFKVMKKTFAEYFQKPLKNLFFGITIIIVFMLYGNIEQAKGQKMLSENGRWASYTYEEGGTLTCYMYTQPIKKTGNYKKRDEPNLMVTRRGSNAVEEVSITSGYPYKKGVPVKINIDGKKINFSFIENEHAWADSPKQDKAMISAMIKGNKLVVRGTSRKGTYSQDSYSLKGFTASYKAIVKACPSK